MAKEKLFDIWIRRNPKFEQVLESELFRQYSDYGIGASQLTDAKGKMFGAGYELYIYAFFIGLYLNRTRTLSGNTKVLGQPILYWGSVGNKIGRISYVELQRYMFIALVTRIKPDVDIVDFWLDVDKGTISENKVVDLLINRMEEYTNYGLYYMKDKIEDNPNYFYQKKRFLDCIFESIKSGEDKENINNNDVEPLPEEI